ncbi:LysR family transcriptional regulator [Aureimonas phyllosphaerae]|uniref:LysR family transcriptional regulator n=1 Tax=Aureimonas phyllosphaerae TaxID=1166078 RepID=UPI003A5BF194
MDAIWLDDYLALAVTLNFSRAAERRNVTQPAFSRRIRALERWVGTDLFVRTTHSVAMTAAGAKFRDQAEMLARTIQQVRRDTLAVAERQTHALTVAATHVLSFTFFPAWIRRNDDLFGRGHLKLISDTMAACEDILARGDAQFLLCHHHPDAPVHFDASRFRSALVGDDTLIAVSAPDSDGLPVWAIGGKAPIDYLEYGETSGLGRIISSAMRDTALSRRFRPVFTSHLAATLLTMARSGAGLAWLPMTLAADDLRDGRLVRAGGASCEIPLQIRLFRPLARQSDAAEGVWSAIA